MEPMALVLIAVLGAATGSFLNVVIHRLPRSESLVHPRSHCPGCETAVSPRDNVPLLSWLWLRARCRSCGEHISARYPMVELSGLVAFAAVVATRGVGPELALLLPFTALLIAVAGIDLEHRIIPNKLVVPALAYGLVAGAIVDLGAMPERLAAGAGAFLFLLLAALAHPAGMGMGDVKLAGVMGLYLGLSVVPALFGAFLSGTLVGVAIMVRDGAGARKKGVPFGPFLALGGLLAVLAGPELVDLYGDLLLR